MTGYTLKPADPERAKAAAERCDYRDFDTIDHIIAHLHRLERLVSEASHVHCDDCGKGLT